MVRLATVACFAGGLSILPVAARACAVRRCSLSGMPAIWLPVSRHDYPEPLFADQLRPGTTHRVFFACAPESYFGSQWPSLRRLGNSPDDSDSYKEAPRDRIKLP